jgi:hypothetical protein
MEGFMGKMAGILWLVVVSHPCLYSQPAQLRFIENQNQWPDHIDFVARTPGGQVILSPVGFSVYLYDQEKLNDEHHHRSGGISEATGKEMHNEEIHGHHVAFRFLNANSSIQPIKVNPSSEYYNYFLGNDPEKWSSGVYAYETVIYPDLYKGIDLRVSSDGRDLKYDFIVAPETDPSSIQLHIRGADALYLENGNLHIKTSVGDLIEKKPYSYQVIDGIECEVLSEYVLQSNLVSYHFPEGYDPCYELVIDPLLIFSTFSGSTADNWGSTATPGENGTLYSSGITNHENEGGTFPATLGAFQTNYGGDYDIAILKYDSVGSKLLYVSYLGGSSNESAHSLLMDSVTQDLLVLGTTSSTNFPVTQNAFQKSFQGGIPLLTNVFDYPIGSDIIVARISANGRVLKASTFVGGSNNDGISPLNSSLVRNYGDDLRGDILTDENGNVFISTVTDSPDFPVRNSFNTVYRGGLTDALVISMLPDLSDIQWAAYLGGSGSDASHTIKFGSDNTIYLAGGTTSSDFPITSGTYRTTYSGSADGWIAQLRNDGSELVNATFTGTSGYDQVYFVDLDQSGNVYVYGQTSGNFPTTPGVYRNPNSGQFIQSFTGDLVTLRFSTVFGSGIGIPNISPTAFMVSECDRLYMAGWGGAINISRNYWNSTTRNMPVTADAYQKTTQGSDFYLMVLNGDATELMYATFLGGNFSSVHVDGGTSRFDRTGIVYHAVCAGCSGGFDDFPTTPGAWSRTNNSGNCNNAAFKFDLSSLRARVQTNSIDFKSPGLNKVCFPQEIRFQNKSTGGKIFEWDLGDGTKITRNDTASVVHQYQQGGTFIVKLKAIDVNTCSGVDSVFTVVNVFMNEMNVQDDDAICFGSSYQLKASGGISYLWSTSEGSLLSSLVKPEQTTKYFVTIRDVNGCELQDSVLLEVVPSIDLKFSYEYVTDCFSRPQLKVKNETIQQSDETFVLDLGDGFTTDLPEILHSYQNDGQYTVRLVGNKSFCVYEQAFTVPVYTLKVPNIITPGSPGYNDVFTIQYGEAGQTPADIGIKTELKIYNRWGDLVYESADYQYDWSAQGLESGIYYFNLTLENQSVCRSWLQVVK